MGRDGEWEEDGRKKRENPEFILIPLPRSLEVIQKILRKIDVLKVMKDPMIDFFESLRPQSIKDYHFVVT